MPTPCQPQSSTPARRRLAIVLLAGSLALGGAMGGASPAAAAASAGSVPTSKASTASISATDVDVRGVLDRLIAEPRQEHTENSQTTAWLRTATDRIPIDAEAVRGVPTGSTIAVRLAAIVGPADTTNGGGGTSRPRRVMSVTMLSRASSTPRTAAVAAVHSVTVVMALPRGVRADGTTAAVLSRAVSGGVSSYWSKVSDGRITFSVSRTIGWTALPASCSDVWDLWDQARAKAGFVPGARRHLLVYVPSVAGCPTGLATVGASSDTGGLAVVGGRAVSLIAHELGHNLGLGHSDALSCTGTSDAVFDPAGDGFGDVCRHVSYGDWYDVMGISWDNLGSLSTAHAYQLGLLGSGAVMTARAPVRVTLRPVSTRSGIRSLRVIEASGAVYVLEYRPASGADAWIGTQADWRGLRAGVLLRRVDPEDPTQTLLLDATPRGSATATDPDVVLVPGQVVKAGAGRLAFLVESVSPTGATVAVAVDGTWPTLAIEPRGRLINGSQVTIGQALAAWGSVAF